MGFIHCSLSYTSQNIKHKSNKKSWKKIESNYPRYGEKNVYLFREGCNQHIRPKRLTKQKSIKKKYLKDTT